MVPQSGDDEKRPIQKAETQGGRVVQVGRDYTQTQTFNFWIPIIALLMVGGALYWGISFLNQSGTGIQINPGEEVQPGEPSPEASP